MEKQSSEESEKRKAEKSREERGRRKKTQTREKVKKSLSTVFSNVSGLQRVEK